jgi:hypothetical protein
LSDDEHPLLDGAGAGGEGSCSAHHSVAARPVGATVRSGIPIGQVRGRSPSSLDGGCDVGSADTCKGGGATAFPGPRRRREYVEGRIEDDSD